MRALVHRPAATWLLLVSLEKAVSAQFMEFLDMLRRPLRFVIDEAHCVLEWSDFRAAYNQLCLLRRRFSNSPFMALTGTASRADAEAIRDALSLQSASVIVGDTTREELVFAVDDKRPARLLPSVDLVIPILGRHVNETGIIFVATVKAVESTVAALRERSGILVDGFHSQLDYKTKRERATAWASGRTKVLVATSAFGMGINNTACRFTIHLQVPSTMIALQQECGRAGRDGRVAYCYLLASQSDHSVWAPVFSNAARKHVIVANGNVPPSSAAFLEQTLNISARSHQRLEEVLLFTSLPYCRRWMLQVSVSQACAESDPQLACVNSGSLACDACCQASIKRGRRIEVGAHAQAVFEIVRLAAVANQEVGIDDVVDIYAQTSAALKSTAFALLNEWRRQPHIVQNLQALKPTRRLGQFLVSLLIVRGVVRYLSVPPDMVNDEPVDHWKRHTFTLAPQDATNLQLASFYVQ